MNDFFYIRVRGKTHGPYGTEQIQQFVRLGKISRFHEISEDGNTWKNASEYADFFPSANKLVQQDSQPQATDLAAQPSSGTNTFVSQTTSGPSQYAPDSIWRVAHNNQELQPVRFTELKQMAINGRLFHGDQVWTSGMPQWSMAGQIPGLFPTNVNTPGMGEAMSTHGMNGAYGQNNGNMYAGGNGAGGSGTDLWPTMTRCANCGKSVLKTTPACPHCGHWVYGETPKKHAIYVLFGYFLGFLGVHNFYANRIGCAVGQLALSVLSVVLFIVSIMLCVGDNSAQLPESLNDLKNLYELLGFNLILTNPLNLMIVLFKAPEVLKMIPTFVWLHVISFITFTSAQVWAFLDILIVKQDGRKYPFI